LNTGISIKTKGKPPQLLATVSCDATCVKGFNFGLCMRAKGGERERQREVDSGKN